MDILISINLGNSFSAGVCSNGVINLCDGKTDLIVSGSYYFGNKLLSLSTFVHSVNLLHGGNLEDYEEFSFEMLDNGLSYALESADKSFNTGSVQVLSNFSNPSVYSPIWSGYVKGTELGENKLTVKCENLSKALKVLDKPMIYGNTNKLMLQRDTTIKNLVLTFETAPNFTSTHPIIKAIKSPQISSSDTYKGVSRSNSSSYFLTIQYRTFVDIVNLRGGRIKFLGGANSGNVQKIKSVSYDVQSLASNLYITTLELYEDFSSVDIAAFDRIEIGEGGSYFLIDSNIHELENVYVKVNGMFYPVLTGFYDYKIVNGKRYLVVYPSFQIYNEIPITASLSSDSSLKQINQNSMDINLALDNNYDTFCTVGVNYSSVHTNYTDLYITIIPKNISSYIGKDVYFGACYSKATYLTNTDLYLHTYLKSGEVSPSDNTGIAPEYKYPFFSIPNSEPTKTLYSTPRLLGESYALPFVPSEMVKIDCEEAFSDLEKIVITSRTTRTQADVTDFMFSIIKKIGLFTRDNIEDVLEEVYIDTDGVCNYMIPSLFFGPSSIGSNDEIAQRYLTSISATPSSNFHYSTSATNYNHFSSIAGTQSSDALQTLSNEGLFVIASDSSNTIYSKELKPYTVEASVDFTLSASDIIDVEALREVEVSDIINFPTITFIDSAGESESLQVISLDFDFPTYILSAGPSPSLYSNIFKFSDNFYSKFISKSTPLLAHFVLVNLYSSCQTSYKKNGISQQGEIEFKTVYLEDVLPNNDATVKIQNIVQLNSQRRRIITTTLPLSFALSTSLLLGSRVKIYHPKIMENASLYGFLTRVETDIFEAKVYLTLLIDTFRNGNGDVDFF